jgi:hypothetical protein
MLKSEGANQPMHYVPLVRGASLLHRCEQSDRVKLTDHTAVTSGERGELSGIDLP